jgi:MFS family permease
MVCAFAFVTKDMYSEKDKYIGYIETSIGFGNTLGPFMGGILFMHLGFIGTFLFFGFFTLLGIIGVIIYIPSTLNR